MTEESQKKQLPKEIIKLLEEKLYVKPIGIEHRLQDVAVNIQNNIEPGKKRFDELLIEIDKKWPPKTVIRGAADGLTYFLFDNIFELYYIGNNSALFIELQGLLESFCIDKSCEFLAVNEEARQILMDAFSKKTLNDVADYFKSISFWTDDEVKFAKKLTAIRNGIAHKNIELVSKKLGDGKQQSRSSIDDLTKKTNVIPYVLKTIELLMKISEAAKPSFFKNPRFISRVEAYSNIIGRIFNLFCDVEFINLPNEVKFTMINRMFGRAVLLSSEKLSDFLTEFQKKVIEFHDSLGVDDKKGDILHSELINLSHNIFEEMRINLKIDGDPSIFIKPTLIDINDVKKEILKNKKI